MPLVRSEFVTVFRSLAASSGVETVLNGGIEAEGVAQFSSEIDTFFPLCRVSVGLGTRLRVLYA